MRKNFIEWKDRYKDSNQDIWIIAGGASMNYVDPSFFDNKITMGVNETFTKYKHCTFYLRKDGNGWQGRNVLTHIQEVSPESKLIVSNHYGCAVEWPINEWDVDFDYWYFEHPASHGEMSEHILENMEGQFANGIGICAIALHLCAFMGFKNIILAGNDNAFLEEKDYFDEYADSYDCPACHTGTIRWAREQVEFAAKYFRGTGINVHGLNPFINLPFEGHPYAESIRDET